MLHDAFWLSATDATPLFVNHWAPEQAPRAAVMLAHGKDDHTANFNQYKAMVAALDAQGRPAELFAVPGEGHGFVNPDNRAELFRRVQAVLDKYIGPGSH